MLEIKQAVHYARSCQLMFQLHSYTILDLKFENLKFALFIFIWLNLYGFKLYLISI